MLSDFAVIHAAEEFGGRGTLVHCYDGRQLILTAVPRETLEDYFEETSLTTGERALLVDRNLDAFSKIIAAKYAAGDFTTYKKYGQTYPLITIFLDGMSASGDEFTKTVLEVARGARWVKA